MAVGAVALSAFITPPPASAQEVEPAADGVPPGSDSSETATDTEIADAVTEAAATGENVEIESLASAESEVYAAPDGTFVEEIALEPYQAQTDDGLWAPIDNTLTPTTDGRLEPANSDLGLTLSGGGDDALVTTTDVHGRTVTYTWDTALPTPTVNGDTATYAEILPGVDLKIRITNTGFAKVFEVKTPEAAASAEVASLELGLALDGFTAAIGTTGALEISDYEGNVVYGGPTPTMWDSTAGETTVGDSADVSWAPSTFSLTAAVTATLSGDVLTLTPDAAMLADPNAVYPIRIDPEVVKVNSSAWAMVSDYPGYRNRSYYNGGSFEKDENGTARLGRAWRWQGDPMEQTWRLAFEFSTSKFRGKDIIDANLRMTLTYSWMHQCDGISATADLHELDAGNLKNWTWNDQGDWGSKIASRDEGIGSGCGAPRQLWTDVTDYVQEVADTSDRKIQFGLQASSESCGSQCPGFRRFGPEKVGDGNTGFYLSVKYNTPPNRPGSFTIDGQSCTAGKTVNLGAAASWTVTAKLSDDEGDNMDGILSWKDQASGTTKTWNTSGADNERATWSVSAADVTGQTYTATVAAKDSRKTGGSSGGCTVVVDTTPPEPPTVSSTDYPADGDLHGAPGKTGRFTVDSTSTDTAGYSWSLQDAYGDNTVPVSTPGSAATIALDPPTSGPQNLSVWAYDAHGNVSNKTTYTFSVDPDSSPVGHWRLDEMTGTTAADSNYPGYAGDVDRPLTITDATWTGGTAADAANNHLDYLTFDGAGEATSASPVVATNSSYTVSAWVRIHQTDVDYTIASQDGIVNSAFMLKYDGESHKFLIVASNQDSNASGIRAVSAGSNITAEAGVWYYVTGVFSYGAQQLQLYVNGQLQNTAPFSDEWNATGSFVIGRDLWAGNEATHFAGDVDEVQVWDRAVSAGELGRAGQHSEGIWDFETIDTNNFPDLSGASNELQGSDHIELVEGFEGTAAGFDGSADTATTYGQVLDTSGDFTIGGWVRLDRTGHNSNVLSQDGTYMSPFYFGYREENGVWQFSTTSQDALGYTWKRVESSSPAAVGEWTHLTVVYRAEPGTVDLYVNGEPQGHGTGFDLWASTGVMRVGSVLYKDTITDYWPGAIDNVSVSTGAFDDQQVAALADPGVRETHSELVTGDFNGDGFDDSLAVVESDDQYSDVYLLENDGTGNLVRTEAPIFESDLLNLIEERSWHLTDAVWRAGDVNGDGADDLVLAVPGDTVFEVWALPSCAKKTGGRDCSRHKDGFAFSTQRIAQLELRPEDGWNLSDTQIRLEDLTGDQADDLVLLRGDSTNTYSIWRAKFKSTGTRGFQEPVQLASGSGNPRLVELAVGDFDADWCGDVAEIRTGADGSADLYVRYNDLSGGRCSAALATPTLAEAVHALDTPNNWDTERDRVTVADVTGDGLPDLVASYRHTSRIRLQVAVGLPDRGGFDAVKAWGYSTRCPGCATDLTSWVHTDVAGGDLDGDGRDDLLTLRAGTDGDIGALWTRSVLRDETTGEAIGFADPEPAWADATTCFGAEGDVNGDGHRDAVLPHSGYDVGADTDAGAVYFVDGATGAVSLISQDTAGIEGGSEAGDLFGFSVATYDADGDGCSEIVAGVPGENGYGYVHVLPGSPGGVDTGADVLWGQSGFGVPGANETGDQFGYSVAAANLPDGSPVLIIGIPGEDVQTDTTGAYRDGDDEVAEIVDAGALVYIQDGTKAWVDQNTPGVGGGVETEDRFGFSIATTPTRFIAGAPFENSADIGDAGGTLIFDHDTSSEGWPTYRAWIDQADAFMEAGVEAGDRVGYTVAAVDYWAEGTGPNQVRTKFAIAAPWEEVVGNTIDNAGLVSLVDVDSAGTFSLTANLIQSSTLGEDAEVFDHVGTTLGLYDLAPDRQAGNETVVLAIGAPDDNHATSDDDGVVHLVGAVSSVSGRCDTLITDPSANANGKFGTGLAATADGLYITAPGTGTVNRFAWDSASAGSDQSATAVAL